MDHGSKNAFYKVSYIASSYRSELLGLLALHTPALAVVEFYGTKQATGVMRYDNDPALAKSKSNRRRVRSGASQADALRALRSIKTNPALRFTSMSGCRHTRTSTRPGICFRLGPN